MTESGLQSLTTNYFCRCFMLLPWLVLFTAYGACVGSFLNVVIFRMPADQGLVHPPSACPACSHPLAWYDNVPVLGWLWLRGRCRYCQTPISIQYPIVEAVTATLFGGLFAIYYMTDLRPLWQAAGLAATWPVLLAHLVLLASLVAATTIDARHYIIPLAIPRIVTMTVLVGLPLAALAFPHTVVVAPDVGAWGVGAAAGGFAGLIFANILIEVRILSRSFSDHDEGDSEDDDAQPEGTESAENWNPWRGIGKEMLFGLALVGLGCGAYIVQIIVLRRSTGQATAPAASIWTVQGVLAAMAAIFGLLLIAGVLYARLKPIGPKEEPENPEDWLTHSHPRREAITECLFLVFPAVGAVVGGMLLPIPAGGHPTVATVLAGCACGYLAGGGIVWLMRLFGTLAFNKEAMGLGDVHLMGAIGVAMGWTESVLVFFLAPFFGLAGWLVMLLLGKMSKRRIRIIPYGPYLAAAALVILIFRAEPILEFFGILDP